MHDCEHCEHRVKLVGGAWIHPTTGLIRCRPDDEHSTTAQPAYRRKLLPDWWVKLQQGA